MRTRSRSFIQLFLLTFLAIGAAAQQTVTGHLCSASTQPVPNAFVRFRLDNFLTNVPKVTGSAVLVQTQFDVKASASDCSFSTSIWDNDSVSPAGTQWCVEYWWNGQMQSTACYTLTGGGPYNLDALAPNTTVPVVPAPTGDDTYLRLDGGNTATAPLTTHGITDLTAITSPAVTTTVMSSCKANGRYIVGSSCYSTVQAAITAAGSSGGTIQIEDKGSDYTVDTVTVPANVNIECDSKHVVLDVPSGKSGLIVDNAGDYSQIRNCSFKLLGASGAAIVANDLTGPGPGTLGNSFSNLRFSQSFTSFPNSSHVVIAPISSWSTTSDVTTVNCSSACGVAVGSVVLIDAAAAGSTTTINGWWQIATASTSSFTFVHEVANDSGASGGVVLQTQLGIAILNQSQSHGGANYYSNVYEPYCLYLDVCILSWGETGSGGANAWNIYGLKDLGGRIGIWFSGFSEESNVFGLFTSASGYNGASVPVTGASRSGTTVTATCSSACGVIPGEGLVGTGFTPSSYGGTLVVGQVLSSTSFSYQVKTSGTDTASVVGTVTTVLTGFECGDAYGSSCNSHTVKGEKVDNGSNGSGFILRSGALSNVIEAPNGGRANVDQSTPGSNIVFDPGTRKLSAATIEAISSLLADNGLVVSGGTNAIDLGSASSVFHGRLWCDVTSNKQTCDLMTNNSTSDGSAYTTASATYGAWVYECQGATSDASSNCGWYYRGVSGGNIKGTQVFGLSNTGVGKFADAVRSKLSIADQGTACTNAELALSAGWGSTAAATGATGSGQTCEWTITSTGTGQAANPTVTDTLTNALPSSSTLCDMRMVGGTGTTTLIDQTTASATAPVFTFAGTPVASSTYKVVRRCGP